MRLEIDRNIFIDMSSIAIQLCINLRFVRNNAQFLRFSQSPL
jgi:hypothetical protein